MTNVFPAPPPAEPMSDDKALEAKNFFRSLYDFKFKSYIAMRFLRILYAVLTVVYSIGAVVFLILLIASRNSITIFIGLIAVPIGYLIYLTMLRIMFEFLMVVFRIGADVHRIAHRGDGGGEPPPSADPPQPAVDTQLRTAPDLVCSNCGQQISGNEAFCMACGSPVQR